MKIIIKKNNIDILEFDELNKTNIFNNIVDFMRTNQVIRKYIKIHLINEFTELEEVLSYLEDFGYLIDIISLTKVVVNEIKDLLLRLELGITRDMSESLEKDIYLYLSTNKEFILTKYDLLLEKEIIEIFRNIVMELDYDILIKYIDYNKYKDILKELEKNYFL